MEFEDKGPTFLLKSNITFCLDIIRSFINFFVSNKKDILKKYIKFLRYIKAFFY